MTNQLTVIPDVSVRVVFAGDDSHEFQFINMVQGRSQAEPSTISDDEMITLAATWLDRAPGDFANMVVSRPETGNILIAPKAVYGG